MSEPTALEPDQAGRPGWRFSVSADLAGRNFATVRVDVVARTDELTSTEMLPLTSVLSFTGFDDFEVEATDVPQQFAEKVHAMTRPWDDRDNTACQLEQPWEFDRHLLDFLDRRVGLPVSLAQDSSPDPDPTAVPLVELARYIVGTGANPGNKTMKIGSATL